MKYMGPLGSIPDNCPKSVDCLAFAIDRRSRASLCARVFVLLRPRIPDGRSPETRRWRRRSPALAPPRSSSRRHRHYVASHVASAADARRPVGLHHTLTAHQRSPSGSCRIALQRRLLPRTSSPPSTSPSRSSFSGLSIWLIKRAGDVTAVLPLRRRPRSAARDFLPVRQPLHRQPRRPRCRSGIGPVAAPWVRLEEWPPLPRHRLAPVPRPHGVQVDVAHQLPGVGIGVDQVCLEPALQEVPATEVPTVIADRISDLEPADAPGSGCRVGFARAGDNDWA